MSVRGGSILLGNGLISRSQGSNVVKSRVIEANLDLLDRDTIIDVGPRSSGKTTRLARWVARTPGARACPVIGTVSHMGYCLDEAASKLPNWQINRDGLVPINIGSPSSMSGYNTAGIVLAIDDFESISKTEHRNLCGLMSGGAKIGYVSVLGRRHSEYVPHFDKLAFEVQLLAKRLRNGTAFDPEKAAEMLEKASQILSPSNGVFPLLEEIDTEWESMDNE